MSANAPDAKALTPQEMREFFEKNGYYPMPAMVVRPRARVSPDARPKGANALLLSTASILRGWKAPLHWTEPPLFRNPGQMYELLGHEEFLEQITDYYSTIRELHCQRAFRAHAKWAIKQILRNFETHVRGFRGQSVSSKGGRITGYSSGQEKWGPEFRPHYVDIVTLPEEIGKDDGRLVNEIASHLRAYAVPESQIEECTLEVKKRLEAQWGIKL